VDFQLEQEKLKRERAVVDAMVAAAQAPKSGRMVGPHYVSGGLAGGLASVVQAFMGKKKAEELDQRQSGLQEQVAMATQDELGQYFKTRDGYTKPYDTTQIQSFMEQDQPLPDQEQVAGDRRKAAIGAFTSKLPVLQKLGESDISSLGKSDITGKELLGASGFDAQSRVAAALAGNPALLKPKRENLVVNNQVLDPDTLTSKGDYRDKFSDVGVIGQGADGAPIFGQRNQSTGAAKFAPQGTSVSVNTGDTGNIAFNKELGKETVSVLKESRDKAKEAAKTIDSLEAAQQDLAQGIKSGAGANIALGLAKWGQALGMDVSPELVNTEAFKANMARSTMALVKNLGAGTAISNTDLIFAKEAAGQDITLDNRSLYRIMNIAKAAAANVLLEHNKLLNKASSQSGADAERLQLLGVPFNIQAPGEELPDTMYFNAKNKRFEVRGTPPKLTRTTATPQAAAPATSATQVSTPQGVLSFPTPEAAALFRQKAGLP
jgi:hypothetical protein